MNMTTTTAATRAALVPGHFALKAACLAVILAGMPDKEKGEEFLTQVRARRNDVIPAKDRDELLKLVFAAGCKIGDGELLLPEAQELLVAQIGREGLERLIASAGGWKIVEMPCEHGFHVLNIEKADALKALMELEELLKELGTKITREGFPGFGSGSPFGGDFDRRNGKSFEEGLLDAFSDESERSRRIRGDAGISAKSRVPGEGTPGQAPKASNG